jgi:high affinity Mn2+ porin
MMPDYRDAVDFQGDAKANAVGGNNSETGSRESDDKMPAPPKPRTLPDAIHAYLCCLHTPLWMREAQEKKDEKSKSDKIGKEGNGDDEAKKNKEPDAKKDQDKGVDKDAKQNPDDKEKEKDNGDKDKEKDTADKEKDKEPDHPWYSAHAQFTGVIQAHSNFNPPYTGPNSLLPNEPAAMSITSTLFLDTRLWEGGELIFNPEIAGGTGFSNSSGIAAFPNGEITRVGVVEPTPYIARLFLRQTLGLGGGQEDVEDAPNELAGKRDTNRFVVSIGKFSATDFFDDNKYSHDPRSQFLPWSLVYNGAWDYPANVRGYTYGFSAEYVSKWYTLTYGIFAEPAFANGAPLDPHFLKANGQAVEWEQRYQCCERKGTVRVMGYLNRANMGDYSEALAAMPVDPSVIATRSYRYKYGFGLSWDQELTKDLGIFGRLGWDDGHTETFAFTAVDRLAEIGLALKGRCWCRPDDVLGLAFLIEGLEGSHRNYLGAGGLDFNIGDGALRYGPEEVFEVYYNYQIIKGIFFGLDFQQLNHPAYNRDRGPVSIGTARFHIEF